MCGIIGTLDWSGEHPPEVGLLRRMLGAIHHRGPDEFGLYLDDRVGIGCARLSILDLSTGQQPIPNEDRSLWIVFNGEAYNYPELRSELVETGHRFSTRSDTEVILHLYEELGSDCLHRLNGQFAIAIVDTRKQELFLARDRLGIRPLFYALLPDGEGLIFGSEIKTLFLDSRLQPQLDRHALAQTFAFWAPLAPRTAFEGVMELPPGHFLRVPLTPPARSYPPTPTRYWHLPFPSAGSEETMSEQGAAERLRTLLSDATRLRLRADVQVGSYLSGGLDSTLIAALIREHTPEALCTFSIAFQEAAFDERSYQEIATAFLGTDHRRTECANDAIGRVFPDVIWHAEAPILRTSPAPMYLLSQFVHDNDIKVVLTGEGADEFLGGYNIYKEDKVRRFWARQPESTWRPLLLQRLYPYVADLSRGGNYLTAFFRQGLTAVDEVGYSHQIRWQNTKNLQRLFSEDLRRALTEYDPVEEFLNSLNGIVPDWSPLAQAQYIEVSTFMSPYLLSSQGDRVMAANSVEGRFPFLDHRVVEFCNQLPPSFKLRGLQEKHVLKRAARDLLPSEIWQRSKQPYRAPIHPAFFGQPLDYVEELLSPSAVRVVGVFDPDAVTRLVHKCRMGRRVGERDDMALVGVISTQLLHHLFVERFRQRSLPELDSVRICRGTTDQESHPTKTPVIDRGGGD
jgi:asparagine synthase (glutamine-hydrolysing)